MFTSNKFGIIRASSLLWFLLTSLYEKKQSRNNKEKKRIFKLKFRNMNSNYTFRIGWCFHKIHLERIMISWLKSWILLKAKNKPNSYRKEVVIWNWPIFGSLNENLVNFLECNSTCIAFKNGSFYTWNLDFIWKIHNLNESPRLLYQSTKTEEIFLLWNLYEFRLMFLVQSSRWWIISIWHFASPHYIYIPIFCFIM